MAAGTLNRVTGGLLLVLMIIGGLVLWIGVPAGVLWGLGELVEDKSEHLLLGLLAVPVAMAAFATLLYWLNVAYLRVSGEDVAPRAGEGRMSRLSRGPLDRIVTGCAVVAILGFLAWLVFGSAGTAPLW